MVADRIDTLLAEAGIVLDIKNLKIGANNTCLIKFSEGIELYIEPCENPENFLVMTQIALIPPGHYRKDIFRAALQENAVPYPRFGVFAYSDQSDNLLLHEIFTMKDMTGDRLAAIILKFHEKTVKWKEAIERGDIPQVGAFQASSNSPMGLFGGPR